MRIWVIPCSLSRGRGICGNQLAIERVRQAPGTPDCHFRGVRVVEQHADPCARLPSFQPVLVYVLVQPLFDLQRNALEDKLPQRREVALPEELFERLLRLLGRVDASVAQTRLQGFGGDVDDFDLVGFVDHLVRHRFPHANPCDACHVQDAHDLRHPRPGDAKPPRQVRPRLAALLH